MLGKQSSALTGPRCSGRQHWRPSKQSTRSDKVSLRFKRRAQPRPQRVNHHPTRLISKKSIWHDWPRRSILEVRKSGESLARRKKVKIAVSCPLIQERKGKRLCTAQVLTLRGCLQRLGQGGLRAPGSTSRRPITQLPFLRLKPTRKARVRRKAPRTSALMKRRSSVR